MIRLDHFTGMIPRRDPGLLPENAAQSAHNVDVTSGALVPLSALEPFDSMHLDGDAEVLKAQLTTNEVVNVLQPLPPSVFSNKKICQLLEGNWLGIWAYDYVSYVDSSQRTTTIPRQSSLQATDVRYTETGLEIECYLPSVTHEFAKGIVYQLRGPRYQFRFSADVAHETRGGMKYGGPGAQIWLPNAASEGDREYPLERVPLINPDGNVYAEFQVVDVDGPNYDEEILNEDTAVAYYYLPPWGAYVTFIVNMHYVENRRRFYYYLQTSLDAEGREGPPSDLSPRIMVLPGDELIVNTPGVGLPLNNVYRSPTGHEGDFRLLDSTAATPFIDNYGQAQDVEVPPFGNPPVEDSDLEDDFLPGSIIHPQQFGVAFRGSVLYLSDLFRFHAWPDEYTIPFREPIWAIAISGNTILVFSQDGNVYGVSGSNPKAMTRRTITTTMRLLSVGSLCKIGSAVYWATHDGLAAFSGGGAEIVTRDYFNRREWAAMHPERMVATTSDNSIFMDIDIDGLEGFTGYFWGEYLEWLESLSGTPRVRFDIDESLNAVTTFSAYSGGTMVWKSKRFWFDGSTVFDYARLVADGYPLTLKTYKDRVLVRTSTVHHNAPFALRVTHGHEWEFQIEGTEVVRQFHAFDRVVRTIGDSVRLTSEDTPLWESIWLKFADQGRFCAGILSSQSSVSLTARFYADRSSTPAFIQPITDGRVFTMPRGVSLNPLATFWEVGVIGGTRIDELQLFRRVTVAVQDTVHELRGEGVPPWLVKRYEYSDSVRPKSLVVHAVGNVVMNVYYDGAATATESITVTGSEEIVLANGWCSSLEFDFSGHDDSVTEVIVLADAGARDVPVGGISLSDPPSWLANVYQFPDRGTFSCASVASSAYVSLLLELTRDGTSLPAIEVGDGHVIPFPRESFLTRGARWEVSVVRGAGQAPVEGLVLMPRRPVSAEGTIRITNPDTIPSWLYSVFEFLKASTPVSVLVDAESSVTIRLYYDESEWASKTIDVEPGVETLIDTPATCRALEFDFDGEDHLVREVSVFTRQPIDIGNLPVDVPSRLNWRMLRFKAEAPVVLRGLIIDAESYTGLTCKVYADGLLTPSITVSDGRMVRLHVNTASATVWDIDIKSASAIHGLRLFPLHSEEVDGVLRIINEGRAARWLYTRWELATTQRMQGLVVEADSPVSVGLFCDGEPGVRQYFWIANNGEYRVLVGDAVGSVEFRVDGAHNDHLVRSITLFTGPPEVVGDSGIALGGPNWRGRRFKFTDRGSFACGTVGASSYYSVTLRLYVGGALVHTEVVTSGAVFVLPRTLREAVEWEVDLDAGTKAESLLLLPRRRVRVDGSELRLLGQEPGVPRWLRERYELSDTAELKSVIVHADSGAYPLTMNVYGDGAVAPSTQVAVLDGQEIRLTGLGAYSSLDIAFVDADGEPADFAVTEAQLFFKSVRMVGTEGVTLTGETSRRGHLFQFAEPAAFACGLVSASGYTVDVTLRLYADGVLVHTEAVASGSVFQFPRDLVAASRWEVDIETSADVFSVWLLPWRKQSIEGNSLHVPVRPGSIPEWFFTEYEFPASVRFRSGVVKASESVHLDLYRDGATSANRTTVGDGDEFAFGPTSTFGALSFDFDGADEKVSDVYLFGEDAVPIEGQGFVMRATGSGVSAWRNKVLRFKDMGSFSVVRVSASDYTGLAIELLVDGVRQTRQAISGDGDFRLPSGLGYAKEWELSVEHAGEVFEVILISRQSYAVEGARVVVRAEADPFTWLDRRVLADRPVSFSVGRVVASGYPVTLKLYAKGVLVYECLVADEQGFRLPRLRPEREWAFDVVAGSRIRVVEAALSSSMAGLRDV